MQIDYIKVAILIWKLTIMDFNIYESENLIMDN